MPASSMKTMATASMRAELKAPKLASYAARPPSPIVLHMCMKASVQLMPAQRKASRQAVENVKYTTHRPRAVCAMRGVSRWSFIGPAVSDLNSCAPPTPSSGRIATTSTMMPMPPISTMKQRHTLIDTGSLSRPVSTVAPVVVSALMASK